jgi:hypothetical protein
MTPTGFYPADLEIILIPGIAAMVFLHVCGNSRRQSGHSKRFHASLEAAIHSSPSRAQLIRGCGLSGSGARERHSRDV